MVDYGFQEGDRVIHYRAPYEGDGFVTQIDRDYDHGGVTTCVVVWDAPNYQVALEEAAAGRGDIQWTNKIRRVEK